MNTQNPDVALGAPSTDGADQDAAAFVAPPTPPVPDAVALAEAAVAAAPPMSVADVLAAARLPEKHARVCLAGHLVAEYEQTVAELRTLTNAQGEVIDDPEASVGEETNSTKAQRLSDRADAIRLEMAKEMWFPLFRGMSSDDRDVFNDQHLPKKDGADLTDYHRRLVAETAIAPTISLEETASLRATLPSSSWNELVRTALEVCTGRIDVPKSLGFSALQKAK